MAWCWKTGETADVQTLPPGPAHDKNFTHCPAFSLKASMIYQTQFIFDSWLPIATPPVAGNCSTRAVHPNVNRVIWIFQHNKKWSFLIFCTMLSRWAALKFWSTNIPWKSQKKRDNSSFSRDGCAKSCSQRTSFYMVSRSRWRDDLLQILSRLHIAFPLHDPLSFSVHCSATKPPNGSFARLIRDSRLMLGDNAYGTRMRELGVCI